MKKNLVLVFAFVAAEAVAGVSVGGGSGSSKALTDLESSAFSLDRLPAIHVDAETLRRAEARLSVNGVETVDIPMNDENLTVLRLHSSIVDVDITKRLLPK